MVGPDGNLNKNAFATAKSGGRGVGAVEDLNDEAADEITDLIDDLANEHFDDADFGE
ncbi:hypothetical protein ACFQMM_00670 [Saliphagus sp. GCM10025308]